MASKFKPGDIVYYQRDKIYPGIVVEHAQMSTIRETQVWAHWVDYGLKWTDKKPGWMPEREVMLHPDPDRVWADYCAWRLTNG